MDALASAHGLHCTLEHKNFPDICLDIDSCFHASIHVIHVHLLMGVSVPLLMESMHLFMGVSMHLLMESMHLLMGSLASAHGFRHVCFHFSVLSTRSTLCCMLYVTAHYANIGL